MTKSRGVEPYALKGLRRKRDALVLEILNTETTLQMLTINLGHVEAAMRMLDPSIAIEEMPERPRAERVKRGSNSRPVLAALHAAQAPLTTKEVAKAILQAHGKPALRVNRDAYEQARLTLRDLRRRKQVRSIGAEDGQRQTWELVRD